MSALRARAEILRQVRDFFRSRGVLEVETPLLCHAGSIDEHLDPIPATVRLPGCPERRVSLVTSPEHSMKRLLAAGSGPIYQVTRGFRDGERGRLHNPEFTILEWYRPGFDHHGLMGEVEDLVSEVLGPGAPRPFERVTYADAFRRACGIDPHRATLRELAGRVRAAGGTAARPDDRDALLNELLVARVEPTLGADRPAFLHEYPASQASSGSLCGGDPPVAERFELYVRGIELANGYRELTDPAEQRRRYERALLRRRASGKEALPMDERLLSALRDGLPAGAGVALGLDRLVMAALGASCIDEVLAFPIERA